MPMLFTKKQLSSSQSNNSKARARSGGPIRQPINNESRGKMIWGRATWMFLHTLAHKIKAHSFTVVRQNVLDFIVKICSLLPCPLCKNHAENYIRNVNFNTIRNKEHLKLMLYNFHNSVNKDKNFEIFAYDKLNSTYATFNLMNTANYFFSNFRHNGFMKAVIDNNKRNALKSDIRDWLIQNSQHLDH